MGRLAFCAPCDADVGAGDKSETNTILLCPSFCRPLREIAENAAEFCLRLGAPLGAAFAVASAEHELEGCYDGIPAARSKGPGPKAPYVRPVTRTSRGAWW